MSNARNIVPRLIFAAALFSILLVAAVPVAAASPATDDQGFVDSTARCTAPDTAVAFGSTGTSRVAVCKTPDGQYQYRGVRVRDGARLILPASRSGDRFTAQNDGVSYTVTASSLVVSVGDKVIREEPMESFHGAQTPATPPQPSTAAAPIDPLPAEVGGSGS